MATATIAGKAVEVDKEGFMQNPDEWNKEIAAEIASEAGISELTDRHWKVIEFMRTRVAETGAAPPGCEGRRTLWRIDSHLTESAFLWAPTATYRAKDATNIGSREKHPKTRLLCPIFRAFCVMIIWDTVSRNRMCRMTHGSRCGRLLT